MSSHAAVVLYSHGWLSCIVTARYVNATAGLSIHGVGCLVWSRHGMFMPRRGCLVTARLSCIDTARDGKAEARLSSRGALVLSSHGTVCSCRGGVPSHGAVMLYSHSRLSSILTARNLMPWKGCLVTARLFCIVTARYVNAAAGPSSHGAVV